jgi:hypothetical protein
VSAELLEMAARALGPLLEEVVFVGGASVHLWISDPGAPATRATDDVDVISAITTRAGYNRLAKRLRGRGFGEASDSPVICRWRHLETGLLLDVMPQDEAVLGFSNPWYPHTIETAVERELLSGVRIRAATPPCILATKLAAWKGRGNNDLLRSLDLHDILVLVDGRPELSGEIGGQARDLRTYIAAEFAEVVADPYFAYLAESAMHGYGELASRRAERLTRETESLVEAISNSLSPSSSNGQP